MRKKKFLEKDVKAAIKADLDARDAWHYMPVQTGYGQAGVPDHIACVPVFIAEEHLGMTLGLFVAIEAKRKGNKATPQQREQLQGIAAAGGQALIITGFPDGTFKTEMVK